MTSLVQLVILLINFFLGFIMLYGSIFTYNITKNEVFLLKFFFTFLYIFDFFFLYIILIYKINYGIFHVYYLLLFGIGFFLGYYTYKNVKILSIYKKNIDTKKIK